MNDKTQDIADLFNTYLMGTYSPSVALTSGHGCKVRDINGMQYLDFTSGIACLACGHTNPAVVTAIQNQANVLVHMSNLFYNTQQILLAQKLSKLAGGGKCFFCNSGAEANEGMVKLARAWGHDKGKYEVITFNNSFHGRTLAMCAATAQEKIQRGFDPLPVGFAYAEFNDIESVKAAINDKTVAVMLEFVQGEGGVIPADPEFVKALRELCDSKGILMLADEIQTGMGRTGSFFAWQDYGVRPDVFTLAKALGGGLPLGAIIAKPEYSNVFKPGMHGTTFGGNPVACAASMAVINLIEEEGLCERATEVGALFMEALEGFAEAFPEQVVAVRGKGLLIGMVVEGSAKAIVDECALNGLLCCTAGEHVVRFLPPLNITDKELEEGLEMLSDALTTIAENAADSAE